MLRTLLPLILVLLAAGCAAPQAVAVDGGEGHRQVAGKTEFDYGNSGRRAPAALPSAFRLPQQAPVLPRARPAVLATKRPLECVPYAREVSGVDLRGNAWTWWNSANGRYAKGNTPRRGAVMVFSKTQRLRLGHLAVVAEVRNSREIVVHQANWLNVGRIHRYTPVRDVSEANDWSEVRVWHTPGRTYGARTYAAYGFIYPDDDGQPETRRASR